MKITSFNPQIVARDSAPIVEVFEALGFEVRHEREDIGDLGVRGIRMSDPSGFKLDVSQTDAIPVDAKIAIRVNVDDFDEAYKILTDHGFRNIYGNKAVDAPSAKSAMMISPSGYAINLIEHIK